MGDKGEDIFSDDFASKKSKSDEVHDDVSIGSEPSEPPKEPKKDSLDKIPDKEETPKHSRKKAGVGAVVIIGVIIGIVYASGIITVPDNVLENMKPIEIGESITDEKPSEITSGSGGTKDVSSASDKVEVEKTKDPIGYYMVTTDDDWYGDFVDIRKIPSKIEKSGSLKVNFRCYTDDFQETSTYFGTFRNVVDNVLSVEVYINGLEVESQSTNTNKALILEGSCYGHES